MKTCTLKIDDSTNLGKNFLDFLKSLSHAHDFVELIEPKSETYEFLPAETLTDEEIHRIEKSKQSGICTDVEALKASLNSQL